MKQSDKLRAKLLDAAEKVIDYYVNQATGTWTEENHRINSRHADAVWNAIVPILHSAQDIHAVEVTNMQSILDLMREGTITSAEAKEFMHLLQTKFDVDELPALLEKLAKIEEEI